MNTTTKFWFYGTLPNGTKGLVVAVDCADLNEAYRILISNSNLQMFSRTPQHGNATWYGHLTLAARGGVASLK